MNPNGNRPREAHGFSEPELERLTICLHKLVAHVRPSDVAITGGVAIQLGLTEAGRVGGRTTIADLDLVASSLDAVAPTVSRAFLISHYHVAQPGVSKFMLQLVDPTSRIRVDVFPDLVSSLTRASVRQIGGHEIKALTLEDILEHKIQTISNASTLKPVDPKHAEDAYALASFLGRPVPTVAAGSLAKDIYGEETDVFCERCQLSLSPHFPLAPKQEIFRLLGWKPPAGRSRFLFGR